MIVYTVDFRTARHNSRWSLHGWSDRQAGCTSASWDVVAAAAL